MVPECYLLYAVLFTNAAYIEVYQICNNAAFIKGLCW